MQLKQPYLLFQVSIMGAMLTETNSQAASQYRKVQDAVFEALSEIPEIMESARRYIQIYADQQDSILEKRTFDLFRAILGTLIQIMRCFVDSSIRNSPFIPYHLHRALVN
jgi:hypothetical protein